MIVNSFKFNTKQNFVQTSNQSTVARYFSLPEDSVSFKSNNKFYKVKKTDFKGIDYATVKKYKIDISRFSSVNDLQVWAQKEVKNITENSFSECYEPITIQRNEILKNWIDYVTKENESLTPVMQFVILNAITSNLKQDNRVIPPILNKSVIDETINDITEKLNKNPKENININKLYQTKLKEFYCTENSDGKINSNYTGWIVIPSKHHDPKNFEKNVNKLKALSHKNWCTKTFNAEPYLELGDFHIYLENGKTKLGVRFVKNEIMEIQGELNDNKIPQEYYDLTQDYVNKLNKSVIKTVLSYAFKILNLNWEFHLSNLKGRAKEQFIDAEKIKKLG